MVQTQLLESGLWTALRTRPYSKTPVRHCAGRYLRYGHRHQPAQRRSAASYRRNESFRCRPHRVNTPDAGQSACLPASGGKLGGHPQGQVAFNEFAGPHPAGLVGTHIHFTEPVSLTKQVWHLNYQDVIAIGKLFTTGELCAERIIAIGGPQATQPRLVRTLLGADLTALLAGETKEGENRIISGSVLSGRRDRPDGWLGRFHLQVSVVLEGREKELFGWVLRRRKILGNPHHARPLPAS